MNTFVIETNNLLRQIERDAKTTACFLCGKKIDSPCNSHLVPRFILKEIAQQGMVEYGQSLSRLSIQNTQTGIKNAFTFFMLCRNCDQKFFSDYENPESLLNFDRLSYEQKKLILLEIGVKNHLSHIFTKRKIVCLQRKQIEQYQSQQMLSPAQLDIIEHAKYIRKLKNYKNSTSFPFQILFSKLLDYKTQLATQTIIAYVFDLNGKQLFNPYDLTSTFLSNYFYLAVLPYKGQTRVLFYIEKCNIHNVESLIKEFEKLNDDEKLHFLFVSLLMYDEQFYVNPMLCNKMKQNRKIMELYYQTDRMPRNWDYCKKIKDYKKYTNYLSREFSVKE